MATFQELKKNLERKKILTKVLCGTAAALTTTSVLALMGGCSANMIYTERHDAAKNTRNAFATGIYTNADYQAHAESLKAEADKKLENDDISFQEYTKEISQYYTPDHVFNWIENECTDSSIISQAEYYDEQIDKNAYAETSSGIVSLCGIGCTCLGGLLAHVYSNQKLKRDELQKEVDEFVNN